MPAFFTPSPGVADGAAGSLRAALINANGNSQNDVIFLQAGTYGLSVLNANDATANNLQENAGQTGDLDVTEVNRSVLIQGQGAGVTIIDAAGLNDRVFHNLANVRLELRDLTVRGGTALEQGTPGTPNGAGRGGGIFNQGELVLDHVIVENNQALGRPNTASNAEGGGVHSTNSVFINASTIRNNFAIGSEAFQASSTAFDIPGGQGVAGGLLVTSNSRGVVINSTISGNQAIGGKGGLGAAGITGSTVGGSGGEGGEGRGGGVGVRNGSDLTLINSTVSSNAVTGGPGGIGGPGFGGASQGPGGNGGNGEGGGISVDASTISLFNSTVAFNSTATSSGGAGAPAGSAGQTLGGGLFNVNDATVGIVNSTSTLFANNSASIGPDVNATFDLAIRSLVQNGAGALAIANNDANGNRVGVDARLAPLANHGGPTATHGLLLGSAAIDAGSNPLGLASDQRGSGFARFVGSAVDIGAHEGLTAQISVSKVRGQLIITGFEGNDQIRLVLAAGGANRVRIIGLGTTLVNGVPGGSLLFTGITRGVRVNLGNGNDRIEVVGGLIPGNIVLNAGLGLDLYSVKTKKSKVRIIDPDQ